MQLPEPLVKNINKVLSLFSGTYFHKTCWNTITFENRALLVNLDGISCHIKNTRWVRLKGTHTCTNGFIYFVTFASL